jgi:multiple sugar transport system ATP-binding protein
VAPITIDKMTKVYPNGFEAVHEFDLDIADGEFMVLVGPSGCGKTTVLRMVAGLEDISGGTLRIGDAVVNDVESKDRDVAMVFQNYALYPHMTVGENIGFALKLRKVPKDEIKKKVDEAVGILGLSEWIDRKPGQLSGGQRQRVAMGRAIVREPKVFLMDEPLSNLDAKLRVQMRAEVGRIQRRLGVATLYVTHDQVEAMTMGDRVAVIRGGVLQQCDKPQAVYDEPKNMFVAGFMGSPAMNLFEGRLGDEASTVTFGSQRVDLGPAVYATRPALRRFANRPVVLGIRPEDLPTADDDAGPSSDLAVVEGEVRLVEALGSEFIVHFTIDARRVETEGIAEPDAAGLASSELAPGGEGVARVQPRAHLVVGARTRFLLDPVRLHFFDPATGEAISR